MDTKLAKPAVSEVPAPATEKPAEFLYCVRCGKMDKVEFSTACGGLGHVISDLDGQADFCCYPDGWTFCAPPIDSEWTPDQPDDPKYVAEMELQEIGQWLQFE